VYDSENDDGKVVVMTDVIFELLTGCCAGSRQAAYSFQQISASCQNTGGVSKSPGD
jgi:hypothetical protein